VLQGRHLMPRRLQLRLLRRQPALQRLPLMLLRRQPLLQRRRPVLLTRQHAEWHANELLLLCHPTAGELQAPSNGSRLASYVTWWLQGWRHGWAVAVCMEWAGA
jgi:hypothetical protein